MGVENLPVDTFLVAATVVDGALVDVGALQTGAAHQLKPHARGVPEVLNLEPDVLSLDGQWQIEHAQGRLQDAEFHRGAVGVGVVTEYVSQIIGELKFEVKKYFKFMNFICDLNGIKNV